MPQFTKASRTAAASAMRKKKEASKRQTANATKASSGASSLAVGRNLRTPRLTAAMARTMVEGTAFSSGRTSSIVLSHGHRQVRDAHALSQAPKKPTRTPRGRALASIDTNASGAGAVVRVAGVQCEADFAVRPRSSHVRRACSQARTTPADGSNNVENDDGPACGAGAGDALASIDTNAFARCCEARSAAEGRAPSRLVLAPVAFLS